MPTFLSPDAVSEWRRSTNVDALVATSPEHVYLFTGHQTWLEERLRTWMSAPSGSAAHRAGYAVLRADGAVGLVANGIVCAEAAAAAPDYLVTFDRGTAIDTAEKALSGLMQAMDLTVCNVGFEFDGAASDGSAGLLSGFPRMRITDCSVTLRSMRAVKSNRALAELRTVAELTEDAMTRTLAQWTPQTRPGQLRTHFRRLLAEQDADFDHFVYGVTGGGVGINVEPASPIECAFFDAGARRNYFFSDTGTTITHTGANLEQLDLFQHAHEVLKAGQHALRRGLLASEAWTAMQDTLQDDFLVAQGHGLGLSIREWPIIGPPTDAILTDSAGSFPVDAPLTPGMVVNLEVGGHHPDGTSVQVEQTFVISPAGTAELLSDQPRETPLVLGAAVPVHNSPVR